MQILHRFRRVLTALAALSVTLFCSGCMQIEQVINVKPDGSGTVVMTMKMSKEVIAELKKQFGDSAGKMDEIDPAKGAEQAAKLGEGVKFVKAESASDDKFEGQRAIFSFTDVTKLRLKMNDMQPSGGDEGKAGSEITFQFAKGSPAKLTVSAKRPKPAAAGAEEPNSAEDLAQAKQIFKDLKITMAIQVEGAITETNATHREGNRVTYLEVPFSALLGDDKVFKAAAKAGSFDQAYEAFKNIKGVKVEPKEQITIEFK